MGSASSRRGSLKSPRETIVRNVSQTRSNSLPSIRKLQSLPELAVVPTSKTVEPVQVTRCPHLPPVGKTEKGTLVPTTPPIEEEHEGYESVPALYNLMNDGFRLPFIHSPEYMLILDARENASFDESHILTARTHTAIDTDFDCSLDSGKLTRFTHIVLYDDNSNLEETNLVLTNLAEKLRTHGLDPAILIGGFSAFNKAYSFLCNDLLIRSERDRARMIRTYPSEVIEGALYQGNAKHSSNRKVIENLGITHVVNATTECANAFEGECKYLHLKYADELSSNMKHRLPLAADFIADALSGGGRVLVHCVEGISRSSTITIAFLMKYRGWSLADALSFLRSKRPKARPNRAFLIQLGDLERELFGKKISDVEEIYMS
ncbi:dual specificity protein phosphatase 6-like [Asterias rubens]|uniref:dual specificity protein phosphatase 6-like n=1 Tax=Asterias rubens TaxID=7604 RepID=UPI0014557F22|nr:dual specificity protein phosphatase 6-like [Asterias rubens]